MKGREAICRATDLFFFFIFLFLFGLVPFSCSFSFPRIGMDFGFDDVAVLMTVSPRSPHSVVLDRSG
jgi:hypothetical protein